MNKGGLMKSSSPPPSYDNGVTGWSKPYSGSMNAGRTAPRGGAWDFSIMNTPTGGTPTMPGAAGSQAKTYFPVNPLGPHTGPTAAQFPNGQLASGQAAPAPATSSAQSATLAIPGAERIPPLLQPLTNRARSVGESLNQRLAELLNRG